MTNFHQKEILPRCEFKILNVFDDAMFNLGKFDIVLSRNMMIYFDDEFRLKCVERLHRMLKPEGRFYAGHADIVPYTPLYNKRFSHGATYYERALGVKFNLGRFALSKFLSIFS